MGSAQPGQSDVVDWRARKDWRGWMTNEREQREKAAARRRGERWGICTGRAQRVAEWLGSSLADKAAMNQTNKGHDHTVRYQPQGSLHLASALFALKGKACIALPSCMVMVSSVSFGILLLNTRWMDARKTLGSTTHHTLTLTLSLLFLSLSLSPSVPPGLACSITVLHYHKTNLPSPTPFSLSLSHTHSLSLSPISQPVWWRLTLG